MAGTAWIDIKELHLAGDTRALPASWSDVTHWQVVVPLVSGTNVLSLVGWGSGTHVIAQDQIVVTSTFSGPEKDTDGDGMPDSWELANGTNPNVSDGASDPDADGLNNLQEYQAGTNPKDAKSGLRLAARLKGASVELSFEAVAGRTYSVLRRDELTGGQWVLLTHVPATAESHVATLLVTLPLTAEEQFYRVITPQQ